MLPAGKTLDAILVPTVVADIPVYGRRLNLSNAGASPGGMLSVLMVISAPILGAVPATVGLGPVARGAVSAAKTITATFAPSAAAGHRDQDGGGAAHHQRPGAPDPERGSPGPGHVVRQRQVPRRATWSRQTSLSTACCPTP